LYLKLWQNFYSNQTRKVKRRLDPFPDPFPVLDAFIKKSSFERSPRRISQISIDTVCILTIKRLKRERIFGAGYCFRYRDSFITPDFFVYKRRQLACKRKIRGQPTLGGFSPDVKPAVPNLTLRGVFPRQAGWEPRWMITTSDLDSVLGKARSTQPDFCTKAGRATRGWVGRDAGSVGISRTWT
jgi:hypothetical protein